jgi:UDP-GlcNAc:undecaprenyl-phosphate GlcNAc-1-phosphate transferase
MELSNILFTISILIISFFINKYILLILNRGKYNLLCDNNFNKPQAFHTIATYRIGGISIFCFLTLSLTYLYFFKNFFYKEYISFCALFFFLGLLDDLKIVIAPKFRLGAMILILMILITNNELYIEKTGLEFLNRLVTIDIFSLIFISLCFLFIINGSNLIDGFNGLLGIHSLIIITVLFIINIQSGDLAHSYFLFFSILSILIFLIFNYPRASIFLGDSGAYLLGSMLAVAIIKTSISNPHISPFFFCILLAYLFFEVFFSFFRKIFIAHQSPLLPDRNHLHMNLYKFLIKKGNTKLNLNYRVTLYINGIYFLLISPAFMLSQNGLFCRYYFFVLLLIYIYFYKFINKRS